MSAAMQWMAAYHKAHPVQAGTMTALSSSDSPAWQKGGSFRTHATGPGNRTAFHSRLAGWTKGT